MKYMLDTNICIYLIKRKSPNVVDKFRASSLGEICVSSITVAELQYGVEKSQYRERNQAALELFLVPLEIVDFDAPAAQSYGRIRAELEQRGDPIGAYDLLIAGHALSLGLTVVTNNVGEFGRINGLNIENWAG